MRSIKKMLLLASAVAVVVAFAAPAAASASNWTKNGSAITGVHWTDNGAALGGGGGSVNLAGTMSVGGELGTLTCPVSIDMSLSAGSSGLATKFSGTPSGCKIGGLIASYCSEVTAISANTPWGVSATEVSGKPVIKINSATVTYKLAGGASCAEVGDVSVAGTITATPNDAAKIASVSLSGKMAMSTSTIGYFSDAGVSGTLNATPSGKYGISNKENVAVSGTIGWNGELGQTTCQVNGTIALEPGSEGKLTALSASGCTSSGTIAYSCGSGGWMSPSMPWTLVDNGTSIAIKNVSIGSCGFAKPFTGELKATPDKVGAISSTTLSGTLNSGGINVAWSGSLNWTPAGVYGL